MKRRRISRNSEEVFDLCDHKELIYLAGELEGKRIMIIGDLMLDRFIYGNVNRISPEAPVPVVKVTNEINKLGGAGNVAQNIKSLGGIPMLVSAIGKDREAETIKDLMKGLEIRPDCLVEIKSRPTIVKTRILAERQQVVRLDSENDTPYNENEIKVLTERISDCIGYVDAIIISDYNKGLITSSLMSYLMSANKDDLLVAIDPKPGNYRSYKGASVITPNLKEVSEMAVIKIHSDDDIVSAARHIFNELKCTSILITLGDRGMALFEKEDKPVQWLQTRAREVFDVTGAGDTVIAAFTLALSAGASMKIAAELANFAAGIVVGKIGTASVTRDEIREYINESK
jgi:rfaE bifunctional protein kinase chain/domain